MTEPQKRPIPPKAISISPTSAANESQYKAKEAPMSLQTHEQVIALVRQISDAPADRARIDLILKASALALTSLSKKLPGSASIAGRFEIAAKLETKCTSNDDSARLTMQKRAGRHLIYKLLLDIGFDIEKHEAQTEALHFSSDALQILGIWLIRRMFDPYQPTAYAISRVTKELFGANGQKSNTKWSANAVGMSLSKNEINLKTAIQANQKSAANLGLTEIAPRVTAVQTAVEKFNSAFLRRCANLTAFATQNAVAANGGHETLDARALLCNGQELINQVRTDERAAMLVCIEIVSHLPSETAIELPVSMDGTRPKDALAWLDLSKGLYNYVLQDLIEGGARPAEKNDALYQHTVQVVSITLTPPLHAALKRLAATYAGVPERLIHLLGDVVHEPNARVVGEGANRCTSRKMQESVPVCLIKQGLPRWPIALATSSPFLVSSRKISYGVCSSNMIDKAVNAAYRSLGWPQFSAAPVSHFVGSFITPKNESITRANNFLCEQADSAAAELVDRNSWVRYFNFHAQWVAFLLALCYARRKRLIYTQPFSEMLQGVGVLINDKNVHTISDVPVPTDAVIFMVANMWVKFCDQVAQSLRALGDIRSVSIADQMVMRMQDNKTTEGIFTLDAGDRIQPVGWKTWADGLPENLRLVGNFARQFWPLQLMQMDIEQTLIDILMRHQLPGLHPLSSRNVKVERDATFRLKAAMRKVIDGLNLNIPLALQFPEGKKVQP